MNRQDPSRLSRAFTEAPPELRDCVELAFLKGEQAMKKRHKLTIALTTAAACAAIFATLALATVQLTQPREDLVVASQGGRAQPTPAPMTECDMQLARPTPEDTPMPTPLPVESAPVIRYATANGVYYHLTQDCSGMTEAIPWTEEAALAMGKQPCPVCLPNVEPEGVTVYYSDVDAYYHGHDLCSGRLHDGAHTLAEARRDGRTRCPVCQPLRPDHYELFLAAFGQGLEALYPGYGYAFSGDSKSVYDYNMWFVTDGAQTIPGCTAISYLKRDGGYVVAQTDWGSYEDVMCFTLSDDGHSDLMGFLSGTPQPQRDMIFGEISEDCAYRALMEKNLEDRPVTLKQVWVAVNPEGGIQAARLKFIDDARTVHAEVRYEWEGDAWRTEWKATANPAAWDADAGDGQE